MFFACGSYSYIEITLELQPNIPDKISPKQTSTHLSKIPCRQKHLIFSDNLSPNMGYLGLREKEHSRITLTTQPAFCS